MSEPRQVYNPRTGRWEPAGARDESVRLIMDTPQGAEPAPFLDDWIMPKGLYTGHAISEVPSDYLRYVLTEWTLTDAERKSIEEELRERRR